MLGSILLLPTSWDRQRNFSVHLAKFLNFHLKARSSFSFLFAILSPQFIFNNTINNKYCSTFHYPLPTTTPLLGSIRSAVHFLQFHGFLTKLRGGFLLIFNFINYFYKNSIFVLVADFFLCVDRFWSGGLIDQWQPTKKRR